MKNKRMTGFSIEAFEQGTIDVSAFDHEAHIFVAWSYLQDYPVTAAIERFTAALRALTQQLGIAGKYHETITWFYLLLIAERRQQHESWDEFRMRNRDLFERGDNVLARYYSRETLDSRRARETFVLPDAAIG